MYRSSEIQTGGKKGILLKESQGWCRMRWAGHVERMDE